MGVFPQIWLRQVGSSTFDIMSTQYIYFIMVFPTFPSLKWLLLGLVCTVRFLPHKNIVSFPSSVTVILVTDCFSVNYIAVTFHVRDAKSSPTGVMLKEILGSLQLLHRSVWQECSLFVLVRIFKKNKIKKKSHEMLPFHKWVLLAFSIRSCKITDNYTHFCNITSICITRKT